MAYEQDVQEIRSQIGEIRMMLTAVLTKMAVDPVELVKGIGEAVAKSQGYDRPPTPLREPIGQPEDLFVDPTVALSWEPSNEAEERVAMEERLATRTGWTDLGIAPPPGEFDE